MKKLFAMVLVILLAIPFVGCAESVTEVSREIVDTNYTEAYSGVETDYQYKYNLLKGEFQLVPVVKTVHHNAKWKIKYLITYDNGSQKTEWCSCTEAEYNQAVAELGGE